MKEFVFKGFPPHKKGRQTFFTEVVTSEIPVVYYESPHRVLKNIELMQNLNNQKRIMVGRELTKMFESFYVGTPVEILEHFKNNPGEVKGEFVIIVH
jgi:16S rRNA (cytidine1402-2'-O)-methyltransferase